MNMMKKLQLMKEIKEDNQQHVTDWKSGKIWTVDYGFIDRDGNKHCDDLEAFPYGSSRLQVTALDIESALDGARKILLSLRAKEGWQEIRIWNIGICNENIW